MINEVIGTPLTLINYLKENPGAYRALAHQAKDEGNEWVLAAAIGYVGHLIEVGVPADSVYAAAEEAWGAWQGRENQSWKLRPVKG